MDFAPDYSAAERPAQGAKYSQYAEIADNVTLAASRPFDVLSLLAEAPQQPHTNGQASRDLPGYRQSTYSADADAGVHEVLQKPPHKLTDDEYFKISAVMTPGPWAGDGRNHEMSLKTEVINGRKALVYDYYRIKDSTKDSFDAKPGPGDMRGRVVFFANEKTRRVEAFWIQTSTVDFPQKSAEFERHLRTIGISD